jgi:D-glycero-D-manno-heptose 1,7-bisphosphate phosphatase
MSELVPAVFLDRDGTLMEEVGFCSDPADVRLIKGADLAILRLRTQGYRIVIVTNQSGIGRGYYTEADFHRVQAEFFRQLGGTHLVDATYFCPDHPDTVPSRRKPAPDMLLDAARELGLDLARSHMVGDRKGDVLAGRNAGCQSSILVLSGEARDAGGIDADAVVATIVEAADWILLQKGR